VLCPRESSRPIAADVHPADRQEAVPGKVVPRLLAARHSQGDVASLRQRSSKWTTARRATVELEASRAQDVIHRSTHVFTERCRFFGRGGPLLPGLDPTWIVSLGSCKIVA